ncbi:nuclear transport factor 2 family protein [Flavobacterium capsici]|uniref:Nuclear transport factor 2 family protein n=1 Tax=Flavobacterium capsici TaxID=3075618 RepID=A0AA96F3C3_9FLAO|nr:MULTISPECIES: nuclear transport factor 2 family protein [unclassified Flavobacterium]WNM17797.1 nuclear transport factor 2 family protein [Flavobacterium sp. PMR2A8]WNM21850.1 nuclear transport factor 2 family protein [Flavobacterium sp. PMTSA4]
MKKITFLLILVLYSANLSAQKEAVQKTIETFFEGFHAKDPLKIKSTCSDAIILQSISENTKGNKLSNETANAFYKSMAAIAADVQFEERILSYNIQVDGSMAHVWMPYEFYVNGKKSHGGVNAFTLYLEGTTWKIIHLIDTRRK